MKNYTPVFSLAVAVMVVISLTIGHLEQANSHQTPYYLTSKDFDITHDRDYDMVKLLTRTANIPSIYSRPNVISQDINITLKEMSKEGDTALTATTTQAATILINSSQKTDQDWPLVLTNSLSNSINPMPEQHPFANNPSIFTACLPLCTEIASNQSP